MMIDTSKRYTENEKLVLEKQGYEFENVTELQDTHMYFMVTKYRAPSDDTSTNFFINERGI